MPSKRLTVMMILLFASSLAYPELASARRKRVDQVPNNSWNCGLCHQGGIGGGPRNSFGQQVEQTLSDSGDVQWSKIYDRDADGDGYTNGEELGDPDGDWEIGDDDPAFDATHPGRKTDNLCGNETLEGPEECDMSNLDGETCTTLGLGGGGPLGCKDDCTFDKTRCSDFSASNDSNAKGCGCSSSAPTKLPGPVAIILIGMALLNRRRLCP